MDKVHFSSKTDDWYTPQDFYDKLNSEFNFTLDVCASIENAKCSKFFTEADNGLVQKWYGVCWMNPPYGREISKWTKKAVEEFKAGCTVVCLVPSRTDTIWWHELTEHATQIRFIKGRLKFGGSKIPAPFPSAVIVLKHD